MFNCELCALPVTRRLRAVPQLRHVGLHQQQEDTPRRASAHRRPERPIHLLHLVFSLVKRLICSTKYGFYGYPKDTYLSTTHLQFSADSHSVAGSLSLATRLQTGDHQPVNLTRALEIAIPAWHSITSRHASLFDALYLPSEIDVRPPARLFPSGRRTWWSRSTTFPITSTCFARSFPARNSDRSNAAFSSAVPAELASHRREIAGFGRSARTLSGRGVWGHMFS